MKKKGTLFLSLLLALSLLISGTAYAVPVEDDALTPSEAYFLESIDYDFVFSHVKYISDEIGVGVAGNPAEKHRAEYLADVLEDIGYEPWSHATSPDGVDDYFQTIENDPNVISIIGGSITVGGHEYPANAPNWRDDSVYKGYLRPEVTGETVYFPSVAEAVATDASLIAGKIVLTHRNTATFAPDVRELEAKDAAAVVFFYNKYTVNANGKTSGESRFAAPTTGTDINIPVILTSYFDGQDILESLTVDGVVNSTTVTVVNRRNTTTQNVLAIKKAVEPTDKFVLIGGHVDSVFGAVGANDNLSGPTSILGIAKALKDIPTKYNVVFAFWGAEEAGLRGSRYFYSNTLVPDDYYKNGIAYFNLDMAATSQKSNSKLTIHTPFRASDNTPIKSSAGEIFERQAARYWTYSDGKWSDWWEEGVAIAYYGNCSDHASIAGANQGAGPDDGIPQVYVFWGGPGVTEYNYHVVGDRYDWPGDPFKLQGEEDNYAGNYSIERAEILASINALSVYEAAEALPLQTSVSALSESAYIGEDFQVEIVADRRYASVRLVNELDKIIGITQLSLEPGDVTNKWTLSTNVGTAGNRTFKVFAKQVGGSFEEIGTFDIVIHKGTVAQPVRVNSAAFGVQSVARNETTTLFVNTTLNTASVQVLNEKDSIMGKTLVAKTVDSFGIDWDYELSIGTAGARVFTTAAAGNNGVYNYSFARPATILVTK